MTIWKYITWTEHTVQLHMVYHLDKMTKQRVYDTCVMEDGNLLKNAKSTGKRTG